MAEAATTMQNKVDLIQRMIDEEFFSDSCPNLMITVFQIEKRFSKMKQKTTTNNAKTLKKRVFIYLEYYWHNIIRIK
tara:strand:- start:439 stop:669 length:231 start_codon:yes stop_codon:yes gene_type:complete